MPDRDRQPWDRQPQESRQAYAALRTYIEQGSTRSAAKVAQEVGKSPALMTRWSSRWSWVMRAAAYDAHLAAAYDDELVDKRRAMADRHARIAVALQAKIVERLQSIDPATLSARDLAAWFDVATKVERAALGVGERVEVTGAEGGPIQLSAMSDEERRGRMLELRRELDSRLSLVKPS